MNFAKPLGPAKIEKMEVETNGNIRELRDNVVFHQGAGSDGEMTSSDLSTLLDRVAGTSAREIDSLIGELQLLRKKLQTDGSRDSTRYHGIRGAQPVGHATDEDCFRQREKAAGSSECRWIGAIADP